MVASARFVHWFLVVLALLLNGTAFPAAHAAAPEKIAVWDPVKGTTQPPNRFVLDPNYLNQVTDWLKAANVDVERLTSDQLNDLQQFSADSVAALIMPGDCFPNANLAALKSFADAGGILIGLNGRMPFVVTIAPKPDGMWTMFPETFYKFQSRELIGHFGLQYIYDPSRQDQAFRITPSPLFKQYLPQAPDKIERPFSGLWIVPTDGGKVYPLLRSQRVDGADVPPQIFIAKKDACLAIICTTGLFTSETKPEIWSLGKVTVVALAKIALDLRSGKIDLSKIAPINLPADLSPPEPMNTRMPLKSVDPGRWPMVARWGKFDGSSSELGPPAPAGQNVTVTNDVKLPRMLPPGSSVTLPFSWKGQTGTDPLYLRVRGGYLLGGTGLRLESGGKVVWNETFVQVDAKGASNVGAKLTGGVPTEFQRVCFIPPADDGTLRITNSGTQSLYLDAIQVECRPQTGERIFIGPNLIDLSPTQDRIPVELSRDWNLMRCSIRSERIGPPGDQNRFATLDKLFAIWKHTGAPLQFLFEGTPSWAAISPERYAEGVKAKRARAVMPDSDKYAQLVRDVVARYGKDVYAYEIWNEPDAGQFWRGTPKEYADFLIKIAGVIRQAAPGAPVISGGMSNYNEDFITALNEAGAFQAVDWIAFHPYAGTSPGWDVAFGRLEGKLFSLGIDQPIYCDESGFVYRTAEWFQGTYNVEIQRDNLEKAMGRLLADSTSRLSIFDVNASDHAFDLIDPEGHPRPAYAVLADYVKLGQREGRRFEIGMTAADGSPLEGLYRMASLHNDGTVTVVLNPGDVPEFQPVYNPSTDFNDKEGWTAFFGKAGYENGLVTVTPAPGKNYVGFFTKITTNADTLPNLEISVPQCAGTWSLSLTDSGKEIILASKQGAGVFRMNYREKLDHGLLQDANLAFRINGGPATFDYIHFLPEAGPAPTPAKPLQVKLWIPGFSRGTVQAVGASGPVEAQVKPNTAGGVSWLEVTLPIRERTVMTLKP